MPDYKLGGWNVVGALARSAIFSNVLFVDGDYGSNDNPGDLPNLACASISGAVAKAGRGDVIYVRPKMTAASAQSYYLDNITVPITLPNLSILGCGADVDRPYLGPAIKTTVAANTTPVLTIKASSFVTEGMEWTGTSQTGDISVIYLSNDGTLAQTAGFVARNCTIRNVKGHAAGTGGGIHFETPIFAKVQNCLFKDNLASIVMRSTYAAINTILIENCSFNGANTTRDVDIYSTADAGTGILIKDCNFNDALPNHGVLNRFLYLSAGISGMISHCKFAATSATGDTLLAANGALGYVPTTVFTVGCTYESSTEASAFITR